MPIDYLKERIIELLGTCYYNLGYKQDPNKKTAQAELALLGYATIKLLKKSFFTLTIKEVEIALERGSLKLYGDQIFGITPSTISGWLIKYTTSEAKAQAMQRIKDIKEEQKEKEKKQPTEEEKKKIAINCCISVFNHYVKTEEILDAHNAAYGYLKRQNLIKIDEEEKLQILKKSQENLKNRARTQIAETRQPHKIKEIRESIKQFTDPFNNQVNGEAKRIALELYFKEIIKKKKNLKDILK